MKKHSRAGFGGILGSIIGLCAALVLCGPSALMAQSSVWATAYYAGWSQGWTNNGHLRAQDIDFGAVTHIVHFSLVPNSNGTIDPDANSMTSVNSSELLSAAHAAGRKVLISVGGWGSDVGFRGATSSANRAVFVANLVAFMKTRGYDGIDIDWETLEASDASQYGAFITALRTALNAVSPRPLLTAATAWQAGVFSGIHQHFDQINIMTYDLAGAWPGWVTWHNAPIYDGGYKFPSTGNPLPSINGEVDRFIAAGVPASKLGVGIDFYGYIWNGGDGTPTGGATQPRQGWSSAPYVQGNVPYYTIMKDYYQSANRKWDASAQAAYLSIDNAGSSSDKFVSYDDETSVQKKFEYARSKGIGGLIIWELGGGYRDDQPAGQRDLLLKAVKANLGGGSGTPLDTQKPTVSITAPAAGATLGGSVSISATASDDRGVVGVQFALDGSALGGEALSAPYSVSWNTAQAASGVHLITATARDAAGNQGVSQVSVTVSNPAPAPVPPPTGGLAVYRDALVAPWINVSWNATITFTSAERIYAGTGAMKIAQSAWGGFSVHSGSWGAPATVDPASYTAVEFAVYPTAANLQLGILLENDLGQSFPTVVRTGFPAGAWTVVTVPMSQLDPARQGIQRLDLMEVSGSAATFYVDEIRFVQGSTPPPSPPPVLTAPALLTPANGATNVPTSVQLRWSPVTGAASYRVQGSYRSDFSSKIFDRQGVTSPSMTTPTLGRSVRVYWRVAAVGSTGTQGTWSATWNFRTSWNGSSAPAIASEDGSGGQDSPSADIPAAFELSQNYPNPFNPTTTIAFAIPEEAEVTLKVYNLTGQEVATLASGFHSAGRYEATWNASDVAGGFYICRLTAGAFSETRKMLLVK